MRNPELQEILIHACSVRIRDSDADVLPTPAWETLQRNEPPGSWESRRRPAGAHLGCGHGDCTEASGSRGCAQLLQWCPTLCDPMDCMWPARLLCPWNFLGKNTGVGCHCLLHLSPFLLTNPWYYSLYIFTIQLDKKCKDHDSIIHHSEST